MNWAFLDDGMHTVAAYDDEVQFASATFTVATFGEEFLKGATAEVYARAFPTPNENARFTWNESTQHLELADAGPRVRIPSPAMEPVTDLGPCTLGMQVLPGQLCESYDRDAVTFSFYVDRFSFGCIIHPLSDPDEPPCESRYGGGWGRLRATRQIDGAWTIVRVPETVS